MKLKEINTEQWQDLIGKFPRASFFHTLEWLKVLKVGFTHVAVRLYAILDEHERDKIIGLLPVEFARKGPFRLAGSPLPGLFTPYQGPLLFEAPDTILKEVSRLAAEVSKAHYFAVSLPPDGYSELPGGEGPANWEPKKTLLLDLTLGKEQLWKNFKAETRNQVRQAEKRGVEIYEPTALDEWLEDYYAMHEAVYSRQKAKPPAKPTFYQALWDQLYEKGELKVILARQKGKAIAGGIFPIHRDTIYFLDGASLRGYQKFRANNLIQWHIISSAASEGLRLYDMVGANIPSIAHFKRGFGGAEVEHPYFHVTRGRVGGIGYRLYQRYRPLLKRLGI